MRTLIVYESMFGNTGQLARRVAAGLTRGGASVEVAEVNVTVQDVYIPGDDDDNADKKESRVE